MSLLASSYRYIGRREGHWGKSCVTRREDLTTLVYIAAARKHEGGLQSNFFLLSPVSRYDLRNTRRHFFRLAPYHIVPLSAEAITYAKRPKSNDRLDLSARFVDRSSIKSPFKLIIFALRNRYRLENRDCEKSTAKHKQFLMILKVIIKNVPFCAGYIMCNYIL